MRLDELTLFNTLGGAMRYHAERAKVLAQNVANAQTPDFVPRDIADGDVGAAIGGSSASFVRAASHAGDAGAGMVQTHAGHLAGPAAPVARYEASLSPDSETTLNGNGVVIEEQMMKINETRLAYDTAVGLYNKSVALMRMAMRSPTG